jgi:hypothetical protein
MLDICMETCAMSDWFGLVNSNKIHNPENNPYEIIIHLFDLKG